MDYNSIVKIAADSVVKLKLGGQNNEKKHIDPYGNSHGSCDDTFRYFHGVGINKRWL